jgi:uracil-DNA glycosylase
MEEPGPSRGAGLRSTIMAGRPVRAIVAAAHGRVRHLPAVSKRPAQTLQMHNAISPTTARRRFARTRAEAAGCRRCELWEHATQTVFGEGPVPARLMLVGEQPGDREDVEGHPFVGPAGRILGEVLELAGIDREATFVTNVVKHFRWRPSPGGKRRLHERPTRRNITACHIWVERELELVQPEVLVALGATAVDGLLGKGVSVTRDHGRPIESDLAPTVLVTIHPSAVLRARDDRDVMFDGLVEDLRVAARALGTNAA